MSPISIKFCLFCLTDIFISIIWFENAETEWRKNKTDRQGLNILLSRQADALCFYRSHDHILAEYLSFLSTLMHKKTKQMIYYVSSIGSMYILTPGCVHICLISSPIFNPLFYYSFECLLFSISLQDIVACSFINVSAGDFKLTRQVSIDRSLQDRHREKCRT